MFIGHKTFCKKIFFFLSKKQILEMKSTQITTEIKSNANINLFSRFRNRHAFHTDNDETFSFS